MAQDRALERIPIELWRDILDLAAPSSRDCEFLENPAPSVLVDSRSQSDAHISTPEEDSTVIRSRLSIIKVCRYWYKIGIQVLWSHIRIRLDANASNSVSGIKSAIKRDKPLANLVIRFTVQATGRKILDQLLVSDILTLIRDFSSLKILICPRECTLGSIKNSLDIAVLYISASLDMSAVLASRPTLLRNIRVLSIDFDGRLTSPALWEPILFPHLECMRLQVNNIITSRLIARYWETPQIQILSISSCVTPPWLDFLNRWSSKLRILELILQDTTWPREVTLPVLKEILFSAKYDTAWIINAPMLERYGLFDIDANRHSSVRDALLHTVDQVQSRLPSFRRLRLIGLPGVPFVSPDEPMGLTSEDIESWKGCGVEVEM